MPSVLQGWVQELPLRMQAVLCAAVRGCDDAPKPVYNADIRGNAEHVSTPDRRLQAWLRACILNPANPAELTKPGGFMCSLDEEVERGGFHPDNFQHYPMHFYAHLMHALEVIGVYHPIRAKALIAESFYIDMVEALHLEVELPGALRRRLG